MEDYRDFLRSRIEDLVIEKGISEYELSYALGKNKNYIRKITSEGALPSMGAFFDICDYFQITPQAFFDENRKHLLVTTSILDLMTKCSEEELQLFYLVLAKYLSKDK